MTVFGASFFRFFQKQLSIQKIEQKTALTPLDGKEKYHPDLCTSCGASQPTLWKLNKTIFSR
jgi:hypothetical protein